MSDKEIDEVLDEAKMETLPEGDFEGELFLSTDGKNTVHVKSDTKEGRKAALLWAKEVYERLKESYGTKQELSNKVYNHVEDLGKCPKCGADNKKSLKGKIYCGAKCWLNE